MLSEIPRWIAQAERWLPTEAILTDRQRPCRLLRTNLHPIIHCETRFKREDILRQTPRCQPFLSTTGGLSGTRADKRQTILESLERSLAQFRQAPSGDPCLSIPVWSPKPFSHALYQQTPSVFLERRKAITSRYTFKISRKRFASTINVMQSLNQVFIQIFAFPSRIPSSAATCIAQCFLWFRYGQRNSFFAGLLLSWIAENAKNGSILFPSGSLVAYFDQPSNRYLYNGMTKQFFHKPTCQTLELSLQELMEHLKSHNIRELAISRLGFGYGQIHWPTVFSFFLKFFLFTCYNSRT